MQVFWLTESAEQTERADNSSNDLTEDLHHFADHIQHWTSSSGCWEEQLVLHHTNDKVRELSHFQRETTALHTRTFLDFLMVRNIPSEWNPDISVLLTKIKIKKRKAVLILWSSGGTSLSRSVQFCRAVLNLTIVGDYWRWPLNERSVRVDWQAIAEIN